MKILEATGSQSVLYDLWPSLSFEKRDIENNKQEQQIGDNRFSRDFTRESLNVN